MNINNSNKVLILSCGTGGGHNTAAKAIQEELLSRKIQADFKEYLEIINPKLKDSVNKKLSKTESELNVAKSKLKEGKETLQKHTRELRMKGRSMVSDLQKTQDTLKRKKQRQKWI